MRRIKAIYDGQQVVLLEPVDLPPNTPVHVVVLDDMAAEQQVVDALHDLGLLAGTAPPVNTLTPFAPVRIDGPPLSETVIEERR